MEQTATYHVSGLTLADLLMLCALEDIVEVRVGSSLRYPSEYSKGTCQLGFSKVLREPALRVNDRYIARVDVITKLVVRVR